MGNPPFSWRFRKAIGLMDKPLLEIFISRNVWLFKHSEVFRDWVENKYQESRYWDPIKKETLFAGVPVLPEIKIYRSQHFKAFPDDVKLFGIIPLPYYSIPQLAEGFRTRRSVRSVRVDTLENGVRIASIEGYYTIEILSDQKKPSAFWYIIPNNQSSTSSKLYVRVIHSENVEIKATSSDKTAHFLDIFAYETKSIEQVPWQGELLEFDDGLENYLKQKGHFKNKRQIRPDGAGGWRDSLADIVDTAFGALPGIGDLYDFAQFCFAGATGKDFFGRKVSPAELVILGAAVALPLGFSISTARKKLKYLDELDPHSGIGNLANHADIKTLEDEISPELKEIILELSSAEKEQLRRATEEAIRSKKSLKKLIDDIEKLIGKKYSKRSELALVKQLDEGNIPKNFLDNLEGFDDYLLQEGYNEYIGQLRNLASLKNIPFRPDEADDIIRWALNRKNYGKYNERLKAVFGDNWRNTFNSLVAASNRVNFSAAERDAIENLFTPGLQQFKGTESELREAFKLHRSTAKKKLKALDWAISRKGTQMEKFLEAKLGVQWYWTLKKLRGDYVVTEVPPGAMEHFTSMHAADLGIKDHITLTRHNKYFGMYYESDHLFGQQFWRNNPYLDSFDQLENGAAWVVPKDAHILNLMPDKTYAKYDHKTKSRLISELIENGTEAAYSPQQLWDVHVYVFHKLGVLKEVKSNLEESFKWYQELLLEGSSGALRKSDVSIDFNKAIDPSQFDAGVWFPKWGNKKPRGKGG